MSHPEIVVVEASDALTHVAVSGRLDMTGVEKIELDLTKQTVTRRKPTIVDISAVEILGSMGVGMLIKIARSMRGHGLPFGVVARGLSKETLDHLNIGALFPIVESYEEALRALGLPPSR